MATTVARAVPQVNAKDSILNRIQDNALRGIGDLQALTQNGLTFSQNMLAFTTTVSVTLADDWIAVTFQNSWVNFGGSYDTAAYRKRAGCTEIRGVAKSGTVGSPIFTLPAAYAPPLSCVFAAPAGGVTYGELNVLSTGVVQLTTGGNNGSLGLACSFRASDPTDVPNSAFPIYIANALPGNVAPIGVLLVNAVDTTSGNTASVAGVPAWTYANRQIAINNVPGLYANRKYALTFIVLGG